MKIGSLCSGYGGLDMAVEYVFNAQTVWMSDIDKASDLVIKTHWQLNNLGNLKSINWDEVEPIDILTAGYPCQPFSHAGQRKGTDDQRHIWPNIKEIIGNLRPSYVILENVRGHLSLGFDKVLADITEIGYDAKWTIVRASDVGAPHKRERLFIIANPNSTPRKQSQRTDRNFSQKASQIINRSNWNEYRSSDQITRHPDSKQLSSDGQASRLGRRYKTPIELQLLDTPNALDNGKLNPQFVEYMMGLPIGFISDLPLSNAQKFRLLGNGVVPQQAEFALQRLLSW